MDAKIKVLDIFHQQKDDGIPPPLECGADSLKMLRRHKIS